MDKNKLKKRENSMEEKVETVTLRSGKSPVKGDIWAEIRENTKVSYVDTQEKSISGEDLETGVCQAYLGSREAKVAGIEGVWMVGYEIRDEIDGREHGSWSWERERKGPLEGFLLTLSEVGSHWWGGRVE